MTSTSMKPSASLSDKIVYSFTELKSRVNALKSRSTAARKKKSRTTALNTLDLLVRLTENVLHEPDQAPAYCMGALDTLLETLDNSTKKAKDEKPDIPVITARDTTIAELKELFDIDFDRVRMGNMSWCLEQEPLDVPQRLRGSLRDLREAFYYESEATCRIAVDVMLVQCCLALRKKLNYSSDEESSTIADTTAAPRTPSRGLTSPRTTNLDSRITLFPELDMSVIAENRYTQQSVLIQGRADWAFGYGTKRNTDSNIIVAMKAKQPSEFSKGEVQLLAYLSILREIRRKAGKTNTDTQGFWTDGTHYTFMCIRSSGAVDQSVPYNIVKESDLKTVFNFIVTMFETAIRSTPIVSPTKPEQQRDKEIECFSDEVWDRAYKSYRDIAVQLASELEEDEENEEEEGEMETN